MLIVKQLRLLPDELHATAADIDCKAVISACQAYELSVNVQVEMSPVACLLYSKHF